MKKVSKQLMILNKDKSMLTWNIGSKFLKNKQTNVNQRFCMLFKKSLLKGCLLLLCDTVFFSE